MTDLKPIREALEYYRYAFDDEGKHAQAALAHLDAIESQPTVCTTCGKRTNNLCSNSFHLPSTDSDNAALRAENKRLRDAILDIDAHAAGCGLLDESDPEGSPAYYAVTTGSLHRALGVVGHTAPKVVTIAGVKGLRPVDPAELAPFIEAMENEAIPEVVRTLQEREEAKAKHRNTPIFGRVSEEAQRDIDKINANSRSAVTTVEASGWPHSRKAPIQAPEQPVELSEAGWHYKVIGGKEMAIIRHAFEGDKGIDIVKAIVKLKAENDSLRVPMREIVEVPREEVIETLRNRSGMAQYVLKQFDDAGYQIIKKGGA